MKVILTPYFPLTEHFFMFYNSFLYIFVFKKENRDKFIILIECLPSGINNNTTIGWNFATTPKQI